MAQSKQGKNVYLSLPIDNSMIFFNNKKSHEVQQKEQDFSSLYSAAFIAVIMQIWDFEVVINIRLPLMTFRMKLPMGTWDALYFYRVGIY